jgi:hypothetical protein
LVSEEEDEEEGEGEEEGEEEEESPWVRVKGLESRVL